MRYVGRVLAVAFAMALALGVAACSGNTSSSSASSSSASSASASSASAQSSASAASDLMTQQGLLQAIMGKGLVSTFVGSDVTNATVTNEDEAQKVIESLIERMGGDKTTELDLVYIIPTDSGTNYYIYRQNAGGVMVFGGSAKLIVDKNGKVIGLVSSILPNVMLPSASESGVTQESAEKTVADTLSAQGMENVKVASEYTTQAIVPLPNAPDRVMVAWVVYVETPAASDGDDQAWLASYVTEDGYYVSSIPVSEPNNAEALGGEKLGFDFSAYDQQEKTFDVTVNGETSSVTLPVLVDKQSGKAAFLGDSERLILCADYTEMTDNGKIVSPFEEDGESFNSSDLAVYNNFIRVYDLFASMGWHSPNGQGTPALLLMNYKEDGKPAENCLYVGRKHGWETFGFGRPHDYGAATDVIAHEFVHCVTSTTMTTNLYLNEPGAINEGMSDILGNLAEMALDGDAGAWVIGEKAVEGGMRSMDNPTAHVQPEYRWDIYYQADAPEGTSVNDRGGVHINSSLLNIISYKLAKAGMPIGHQMYYWMNVALTMTPTSDYAEMAEILPWVLEQLDYGEYADALKQAIDEAGYLKLDKPTDLPAGAGAVELVYPNEMTAAIGNVRISLYDKDKVNILYRIDAWPGVDGPLVSIEVPAGDYYAEAIIGPDPTKGAHYAYTDNGWVTYPGEREQLVEMGTLVHVDEGKATELSTNGFE